MTEVARLINDWLGDDFYHAEDLIEFLRQRGYKIDRTHNLDSEPSS